MQSLLTSRKLLGRAGSSVNRFQFLFNIFRNNKKHNLSRIRYVSTQFIKQDGYISDSTGNFKTIRYWIQDHVAHIMLDRPQYNNAIDLTMPFELKNAIQKANCDEKVRVILMYGAGNVFSSGYDFKLFAEKARGMAFGSQEMPWDPALDFRIMAASTSAFMEIWKSMKPVVAKIKRIATGGGSDLALVCDMTFIEDTAKIGYPPSRVWGCPTTAFWFYRVGMEKAKRILLSAEVLSGKEAVKIGLVGESVPDEELDERVDEFVHRIVTAPSKQLRFQKQIINQAVEQMGLLSTQRLATIF